MGRPARWIFVFVFLSTPVWAADPPELSAIEAKALGIVVGPRYPVIDARTRIYDLWNGKLLAIKVSEGVVSVQHFDPETLKEELRVQSPFQGQFENIVELGTRRYLFYSTWDKKAQVESLWAATLDVSTGTLALPKDPLVESRGKITGTARMSGFYRIETVGKWHLRASPDEGHLLVEYRKKPTEKDGAKNRDVLGLHVFDATLRATWGREVELPYTEERMDTLSVAVADDGAAWIAAKVREGTGKRDTVDGEPNYHLELLRAAPLGGDLGIVPISVEGRFLQSLSLFDSGGAGLMAAGLYNDGVRSNSADGFFSLNLGMGAATRPDFHPIPSGLAKEFATRSEQRKAQDKGAAAAIPYLTLQEVVFQNNGRVILVAEQRWVLVTITRDSRGNEQRTYRYYFEDILVASILPNGSLHWMKRIPKAQVGGSNPGPLSFASTYRPDDVAFAYVDNPRNLRLDLASTPSFHVDGRGGFLTELSLDHRQGARRARTLLPITSIEGVELKQVSMSRVLWLPDGSVVMEAYATKKQDVWVRVPPDADLLPPAE